MRFYISINDQKLYTFYSVAQNMYSESLGNSEFEILSKRCLKISLNHDLKKFFYDFMETENTASFISCCMRYVFTIFKA